MDLLDFRAQFARFEEIVDNGIWVRHTRDVERLAAKRVFLSEYLLEKNRVAICLRDLSSSSDRGDLMEIRSSVEYEACVLVAQFLSLYESFDQRRRRELLMRFRAAITHPDDLRALQFEWLVATHLSHRGFEVEFVSPSQRSSHDMTFRGQGVLAELECKSISNDLGRRIHRREGLELREVIFEACQDVLAGFGAGLLIRVSVSKRFPTKEQHRRAIGQRVKEAILGVGGDASEDLRVEVREFQLEGTPFEGGRPTPQGVRDFAAASFGIRNKELFAFETRNKGAILMCLESRTADRVVAAALDLVRDACDRQLSSRLPGVVCAKFEDITARQMEAWNSEVVGPTALGVAASRLLEKRANSHLVCVCFFSDGSLIRSINSVVRMGATFFFPNRTSPMFNETIVSAFRGINSTEY